MFTGNTSGNSGNSMDYRISKTGLNQLTKTLAVDWRETDSNLVVVAMTPGWTPTRMSNFTGPDAIEEVASSIANTVDRLSREDSGRFMTRQGKDIAL